MKYYVVSITKYNDGTKSTFGITEYDNMSGALKVFHQKFANAIGTANINLIMVQIVNDYGVVSKSEYYEVPKVEETPETPEEP